MVLTAVLIVALIALYIVFYQGNKMIYSILSYFFCIAATIMAGILYFSKTEVYKFMTGLDYKLYLMIQMNRVNIADAANLYNLCICAFLLCSVIFIHLLTPNRHKLEFLLILPVAAFFVFNSPQAARGIFITEKLAEAEGKKSVLKLMGLLKNINMFLPCFYMLCPFYSIILYFKRTKIITKKKISVMLGACIVAVDIYFYVTFIEGPFKHIWVSNIDASKVPKTFNDVNNYGAISAFSVILLVAVLFITLYYNPFYTFKKIRKKEMLDSSKLISENVFMALHVYKNAFFAVGQQFELVKLGLERNEEERAAGHADKGLEIVRSYMDMLNRTLGLFKNMTGCYAPVNITEVIEEALDKTGFSKDIVIHKNYDDEEIKVFCSRLHMTELFVNLFTNATEALSENKGNTFIEISVVNEEDLCMISIKDNGCGIEKKNLKKIFTPFFSSKPRAKSGGVGLSYVEKVIKHHHGDIIVKSEVGKYTVFSVVLQKYREKERGEKAAWIK